MIYTLLKTIGTSIAKVIVIPLLFVMSLSGHSLSTSNLGGYNPTGGTTYHLGASISSTQTTVTLSSFLEPTSGFAYTMANMSTDIAYGTIEPQTGHSEFISFTGITQNSDGSALLTGVSRGLARSYPFTASSTFQLPHSGQSIFILSAAPGVYNEYLTKRNNETITGNKTFNATTTFSSTTIAIYDGHPCTAGSASTSICDKSYSDALANQGAATATNAVAGITRLSVAAVNSNIPIAVGQNDPLVSPVSLATLTAGRVAALAGASSTPSASNLYLTQLSAATTSMANAIPQASSTGFISHRYLGFGGNGTDGALALTSGTTTINLSNAEFLVKNYSSISITGTGALAFSNAFASGTKILLRSQGDVTLTSSVINIDASGLGGVGGTAGASILGSSARGKGILTNGGGQPSTVNGGAVPNLINAASSTRYEFNKYFNYAPGGGGQSNQTSNGAGGAGGGVLIIEVGGKINFTTTNGLSVAGINGTNGTGDPGAGGGGGGGGTCILIYNDITALSGTCNVNGGSGGLNNNSNATGGGGGGSIELPGLPGTASASPGVKNGGDGGKGIFIFATSTDYFSI